MKNKVVFFLLPFLCLFDTVYSANYVDYKDRLNELEKQIKELKVKTISNNNLPNFTGRFSVLGSIYMDDFNNEYRDKLSIKTARIGIIKPIDNFYLYMEANYSGDNPAKNSISLGQTFIGYIINDSNEFRIGRLLAPAFMENEKNGNIIQTSESSVWLNFIPANNYLNGINYLYIGNKGGISIGLFDNNNLSANFNEKSHVFSAFRGFYTPVRNLNNVIHFGADFGYNKYDNSEIYEAYYYGFELAMQHKNITFENEFVNSFHNHKEPIEIETWKNSSFGFTNQLTIGLTGENRIYDKYGSFGFTKVKNPISQGGYGAFESVLKFSRYNGKELFSKGYNFTVGINWFPIDNVMVLFNYSRNKNNKEYDNKDYNVFKFEARMWF